MTAQSLTRRGSRVKQKLEFRAWKSRHQGFWNCSVPTHVVEFAPSMSCRSFVFPLCILCSILLSSCMSQQLTSQSGLYDVPLEYSPKAAANGFWAWDKGGPCAGQAAATLHIAPLNVALVQEDYPELAPQIAAQMQALMENNTSNMLTRICRECASDRSGGTPLRERLDERTLLDVLKVQMGGTPS